MKYQKCQMQMGAYALALEHTVNIVPEIIMTFVATKDRSQVFAIQGSTIEKYKQKWLDAVAKYYSEILPAQNKIDLELIDGDAWYKIVHRKVKERNIGPLPFPDQRIWAMVILVFST